MTAKMGDPEDQMTADAAVRLLAVRGVHLFRGSSVERYATERARRAVERAERGTRRTRS